VVVRSAQELIIVNLAIEPVENPEEVRWVDPSRPPLCQLGGGQFFTKLATLRLF
jgi:hypothetical protein